MSNELDKWKLNPELIRTELKSGTIPSEMICLGCAAKVSLVDTVYPALEQVRKRTANLRNVKFQRREDSYTFKTNGRINLNRVVLGLDEITNSKCHRVSQALRNNGPGGAILLFNFQVQPKIELFADVLTNLLRSMEDAETDVVVGKGHTVQLARIPEETLAMADFIGHSSGNLWGLANNDTISNVDPMLPHTHKFAVTVAMHNTLNDLFIYGIHEGFTLYPSYDARDEEGIESIRSSLEWYAKQFSGIGIEIKDLGPLNTNNKLIGATAIGFSDKEIPINAGLIPGQKIIATRPVGDLAPLNEYLIRCSLDEDVSDIENLREKMISTMLVPNVEAAKIIRDYLPNIGDDFDPARHITATRDMSGPGMRALEELAEDSGCSINLELIRFHDEMIPEVEVSNVTAGTNGAILIGVSEGIHQEIFDRLVEVGYDPWIVGTVGEKTSKPEIVINPELIKYDFLSMGKGFFSNYRFG